MTESLAISLDTDFHVHSTHSRDGLSTLKENVAQSAAVGLTTVRLVEHVRASTTWVPEFVAAVGALKRPYGLMMLTGVEATILDLSGRLDVPRDLVIGRTGVDRILLADHRFPGPDGPWSAATTRSRLAAGLATADAIDMLVLAMTRAMRLVGNGQLAHPFSILPKIGLAESDLRNDHLAAVATAASVTGTLVEVNEKLQCPGIKAIQAFVAAGATMVPASDSSHCGGIGQYTFVRRMVRAEVEVRAALTG